MSLDGPGLLGRAERVVERALSRGAEEAECFWESGASLDVDIEGGDIAAASSSRGSGAAVRVVRDGRLGFAYFTQESEVTGAIERALGNLPSAPKKGYRLPAPGRIAPLPGRWDDRIAALDEAVAGRLVDDLLQGASEACPGTIAAGGGVGLDAGVVAIASSTGVSAWDRETSAGGAVSLILEEDGRAVTTDESAGSHRLDLDAHGVGTEAGTRLRSLRNPVAAEARGAFDVVLRPNAVAELLTGIVVSAATGDEAKRGRSMWSDELGKPVADAGLTITDDSRHPEALGGVPFDDEGVPTGRVPLVEGGTLRNFLYDSWDAHEHREKTTASAVRGGFKARPETGAHHVVAIHRETKSQEELVAEVADGFLVESVLGAHTANATTGDFSVTAPVAWRIRRGTVAEPVSEIAIAGNLGDLLRRVDGASRETKRMEGALLPALRFRGVAVSS